MNTPDHLHYTEDHEWANYNGNEVSIGITDFAQSQLGDVIFVELPEVGEEIARLPLGSHAWFGTGVRHSAPDEPVNICFLLAAEVTQALHNVCVKDFAPSNM